ncbi:Fc receptor 5 [Labeo rohita]|uniref:Fc receptor 5 n=1 Tax=Labeo rohita TaxID=84645 RepID=A0A498LX70_LABRO|nr:Fc receptor 5 [Labeo rohita]
MVQEPLRRLVHQPQPYPVVQRDHKKQNPALLAYQPIGEFQPKPELTSDPAGAALTGNTVTLICRMDPSTGWDFYWYKHTLNSETKKTKTNSYRVKIDSVSDGGQYWCRAGRGKPVYYTQYSEALWVNVAGANVGDATYDQPIRKKNKTRNNSVTFEQ